MFIGEWMLWCCIQYVEPVMVLLLFVDQSRRESAHFLSFLIPVYEKFCFWKYLSTTQKLTIGHLKMIEGKVYITQMHKPATDMET